MSAKQQYQLACSIIRHCRMLRTNRHWKARQQKWIDRATLMYSIEQHIVNAAVESTIMNKPQFSDTRSMSNRLLDDWKALTPVTQSDFPF